MGSGVNVSPRTSLRVLSHGDPWCRCKLPRIDIRGCCVVCGLERFKVQPKVATFVAVDKNEAA